MFELSLLSFPGRDIQCYPFPRTLIIIPYQFCCSHACTRAFHIRDEDQTTRMSHVRVSSPSESDCQLALSFTDVTKLAGHYWTLSGHCVDTMCVYFMLCIFFHSGTKLAGHGTLIKTKRRFYVFSPVRQRREYELADRRTDGQTDSGIHRGRDSIAYVII